MEKKKILIVEDEQEIATLLQQFLEATGYETVVTLNGLMGYEEFQKSPFDLLILDVMMPKIDGFTLCEMIRRDSHVPILMLTALSGEEEQVRGFELQVDDYVTKPFSMKVLLKRVENIFRHQSSQSATKQLRYSFIDVDEAKMEVRIKGERVELTAKEYELVCYFLHNQSRVITREELLEHIWRYEYCGDGRVIDTHVKNIRKKLSQLNIQTIRGRGYLLDEEEK